MLRLLFALYITVTALLTSSSALADNPVAGTKSDCDSSGIALPPEEPSCVEVARGEIELSSAAREQWQRGREQLQADRFEEALASFERAYAQSKHPALRLNQALAYAGLCRREDGVRAIEQFLAEAAGKVDTACTRWLEQALAALRPLPPPPPPPAPAPRPQSPPATTGTVLLLCPIAGAVGTLDGVRRSLGGEAVPVSAGTRQVRFVRDGYEDDVGEVRVHPGERTVRVCALVPRTPEPRPSFRVAGYIVGGAGVAAVGVGVALALVGWDAQEDAAEERDQANAAYQQPSASPLDQALAHQASLQAKRDYESANPKRIGGIVVASVGGALVATGVVLLALTGGGEGTQYQEQVSLLPWVDERGGGGALTGRF
jgi:hypothetical protein